MREYSKVAPTIWTGETGRRIRSLGKDALLVAFHLMTSTHANMYGLYYVPIPFIAHETGMTREEATEALENLCDVGYCHYDPVTEWVFVVEMAKYQILKDGEPLKSGDNRIKGINKDYCRMPANSFLFEFYERYKHEFYLDNPRGEPQEHPPPAPLQTVDEPPKEKETPPPKKMNHTERAIRECVAEQTELLKSRFPDVDIGLETEEIVAKYRNQSIGPDPWLLVFRWFRNLKGQTDDSKSPDSPGNSGRAGPARSSPPAFTDGRTEKFCGKPPPT